MLAISIVAILITFVGSIWRRKVVARAKLIKQKEHPITLSFEHLNQLFTIREVEEVDKSIVLLSANPNHEHFDGTGFPFWASLKNDSENSNYPGKIIKLIIAPNGEIKSVSFPSHELPRAKKISGLESLQTVT